MSDQNDDAATNEPVATGWLRTELAGDEHAAAGHIQTARALLGGLRSYQGVNDRIAAGDAGGFYRQHLRLPDGTLITATTNNGVDTVRIEAPFRAAPAAQVELTPFQAVARLGEITASTQTPADATPAGDDARATSAKPIMEDASAVHTSADPIEEKADPIHTEGTPIYEDADPIITGADPILNKDTVSIELEESEPEEKKEEEEIFTDYHPYLWIGARIVSGGKGFSGEFLNKIHLCVFETEGQGEPDQVLSNRNHLVGFEGSKAVYPLQPVALQIPTNTDPRGFGYLDSGLVQISRDQPAGYDIPMFCPLDNPNDPNTVTWDEMVIGDPDNDLKLRTADNKALSCAATGSYMVKIMVEGGDCDPNPPVPCVVELRVVTGKRKGADGDFVTDNKHRFTIHEFTTYKMGILPFGWFGPFTPPSDDPCVSCGQAAPDHGPNPHGPHWWQGGSKVFVPVKQEHVPPADILIGGAAFSKDGEALLPKAGFNPGGFPARADRCVMCATVTTYYASFGFGVQQGTVDTGGSCGSPEAAAVQRTEHAEFAVFISSFPVSSSPLFTDYGLLPGTTAYASNGNAPAPFSVGVTIGSPETIVYHTSGEVVVNLADGAGCISGVWFPGTPTNATAPPFSWNDFAGVHVTGFSATYKYSRRYDIHGVLVPGSKHAQWVSLPEYLAVINAKNDDGTPKYSFADDSLSAGNPDGAGGGTAVMTCARVERP